MGRKPSLRKLVVGVALDLLYGTGPPSDGAFRSAVHWDEAGSAIARDAIASGKPCMIGRLGSAELSWAVQATKPAGARARLSDSRTQSSSVASCR